MDEDLMEEQKMKELREKFRFFKLEEMMNRAREYKEQGKTKEEVKLMPNMNYLDDEELDQIFNEKDNEIEEVSREKLEKDSVEETSNSGDIIFLKDEELVDYENQPFSTDNYEDNQALMNSIKINGIIEPIVVRLYNGKYQILSGHRRRKCGREVGLTEFPCYVMKKDDEDAKLYLVDTNLVSRKNIKPTERAKAYLLKQEALKIKKLKYEDEFDFREELEKENKASRTSIQRYLRINYLIDDLQEAVDDKIINLKVAEQLSFLRKREQEIIDNMIKSENKRFTENQIKLLKDASKEEYLTKERINEILNCKDKEKKINIAFSKSELSEFFGDVEDKKRIKKYIMKLLREKNGENSIVESGVKNELWNL